MKKLAVNLPAGRQGRKGVKKKYKLNEHFFVQSTIKADQGYSDEGLRDCSDTAA